jgi:putative transposase
MFDIDVLIVSYRLIYRYIYHGGKIWMNRAIPPASTVGHDEQAVREYIRSQEKEDRRIDQLNLFK